METGFIVFIAAFVTTLVVRAASVWQYKKKIEKISYEKDVQAIERYSEGAKSALREYASSPGIAKDIKMFQGPPRTFKIMYIAGPEENKPSVCLISNMHPERPGYCLIEQDKVYACTNGEHFVLEVGKKYLISSDPILDSHQRSVHDKTKYSLYAVEATG